MSNSAIIADPGWFPLRLNLRDDSLQFCPISFEMHRAITFLSDLRPAPQTIREVQLGDILESEIHRGPLHFIQHSGMNGSTLLARILSQWGIVNALKEPPILRDLVAFRTADNAANIQRTVAALMSRPWAPGMATVVKLNNVGNALAGDLAALFDHSRILCMHAPLAIMLSSLANKGGEGRSGARRLYQVLRHTGAGDFDGLTDQAIEGMADLQLGALAWLAMQRQLWSSANRFGDRIVRSIDSETFIARPRESLSAIASHFGFVLDIEQRVAAGVFHRHSKTGEPFNAELRRRALAERLQRYGSEIQTIVEWTRDIAKSHRIPWELPFPLKV